MALVKPLRHGSSANEVLAWLASQEDSMVTVLRSLVDIDSGSYDKAGVDRVGGEIRRFLEHEGIDCHCLPQNCYGDILRAEVAGEASDGPNILLMGHCDTVFPSGEAALRPFKIVGDNTHGPGVADMKSGLVLNSFVLAALARFGGAPAPVVALYTGDEEIASPSSSEIIKQEGRQARAVFNAEPARPSGNVVTGRRGCIFVQLTITGRAAHSGGNFSEGISALGELAEKTVRLHALSDMERRISVNVGLAQGGQSVNTVAPNAIAAFDVRYGDPAHRGGLMTAVEEILTTSFVPGTRTDFEVMGEFPAFSPSSGSEALFRHYVACGGQLGETIGGEYSMGSADSGFTAIVGAPTLCGTGPVGGKLHSPDEYMDVRTLGPRAQTLALAILTMAA